MSAALPPADLKPRDGKAYVVGDKSIPLSRRTVWDTLKRTAEKFGARDAAVFVEHGVRWSWSDLLAKCDDLAAGLLALGLAKGRPHRHLVAQPAGMAVDAICNRTARSHPRQHQSGLSRVGA